MAICGFRADNFPFGLLEGGDLDRLTSLLERVQGGLPEVDVNEEWTGWIEACRQAGLMKLQGERVLLQPEGERLLSTCRALLRETKP
jgi:hypothetical protein